MSPGLLSRKDLEMSFGLEFCNQSANIIQPFSCHWPIKKNLSITGNSSTLKP